MLQIAVNGNTTFDIEHKDNQVSINGAVSATDIQWQPNGLISIRHNNRNYTAILDKLDKQAKEMTIRINGQRYTLGIKEDIDLLLAKMGLNMDAMQQAAPLKAPMPGMVLKVLVSEGQTVSKGDGLLVLEAMKMENVLKATGNATIKSIRIQEKTAVEKGTVLIEME